MKNIRISRVPAIFLLMMLIFIPVTESSAMGSKKVVILDFPDLEWSQIASNHPTLLNLFKTGSTGLVRLPATLTKGRLDLPVLKVNYARSSFGSGIAENSRSSPFKLSNQPIIIVQAGASGFHPKSPECFQNSTDFYEDLFSRIAAETDFESTLLVLCAHRTPETNTGLTPVLLKGAGFSSGVLYSPSTRKQGIVTFNDLRSTVRRFLNPDDAGTVFQIRSQPGDWRKLAQNRDNLIKNYRIRWPLLTGYFYLFLGVVLLLLIGFFYRFGRKLITGLAWSYLFLITAPATFLLEAILDQVEWPAILSWTIGISGVIFLGSYFFSGKDFSRALLVIAILTAGLVAGNGLLNGYYECKSFLGYSVVAGARYYGIGNEYMGVLLGSALAGLSIAVPGLKHRSKPVLWLVVFLLGLVLIHPNFGADVGGGITVLMGLGITNYLWLKQPIRIRELIRLGLMTLTALVLAGAWDLYVNRDSMSHLGQLLMAIGDHGPMVFCSMVIRKLSLNLRLISSTPLTLVLIGILLAIPFLYRFPPASLQKLKDKHPEAVAGLTGLAVTGLIGFLVNDSGIVSAAMILMFGIGLGLTVGIKELD